MVFVQIIHNLIQHLICTFINNGFSDPVNTSITTYDRQSLFPLPQVFVDGKVSVVDGGETQGSTEDAPQDPARDSVSTLVVGEQGVPCLDTEEHLNH